MRIYETCLSCGDEAETHIIGVRSDENLRGSVDYCIWCLYETERKDEAESAVKTPRC